MPQIPVGGRLKHFITEWEKITDDQWVLSTLREGVRLEFQNVPHSTGVLETKVSVKNRHLLFEEVESLLSKGAIEPVPPSERQKGFYCTLFLVAKKAGEMRPVINLRPLNRYLVKKHFKMDTLIKVINLVKPKDWAVSIDLKDAYFHVPIYKHHRQYLRFCIQGRAYQFRAMCFRPTQAPRVFTKIVSVVAAYLRIQNIRIATYLDDWLITSYNRHQVLSDREKTLNLLVQLGFIVNINKSTLEPTQKITYLGSVFDLKQGLVFPTVERVQKLEQALFKHNCQRLLTPSRDNGIMHRTYTQCQIVHASPSNSFAPLLETSISKVGNSNSSNSTPKGPFELVVQPNKYTEGQVATATISNNNSDKSVYGGHIDKHIFQGQWSPEERKLHINQLELEAVYRSVVQFLPLVKGETILVRCDNTTVVQLINKQGGTRSPTLCYLVWKLWTLAIENNMVLKAAHLACHLNILADHLSRTKVRPSEWSLSPSVVFKIFSEWGEPMIDLFASADNHKFPIFCSWIPDHRAYAIDALTISWEGMFAYVYPPICLIPKVLQHMQKFNCQIILIAPQWPCRHWYTNLLQMSVESPMKLPIRSDLLSQPKTKIFHPNPEVFSLSAWLLSTKISKQKAFQSRLENCSLRLGARVQEQTIVANSRSSIAGVVNGRRIPMLHL